MLLHSHHLSYNTNQNPSSLPLQMTLSGSLSLHSSTSDSLVSLHSQDYPPTISHHLATFLFPSYLKISKPISMKEKHRLDRPRISEVNPEETVDYMIKLISSQSLLNPKVSRSSHNQPSRSFINNDLFEQTFKIGTYQLIIHFTTRILKAISYFHSNLNKNDDNDDDNHVKTLHMAYSILTNPIFLSQRLQPEQYSDIFSLIFRFRSSLISEFSIWSQYSQPVHKEEASRPKPKALSIITPKIIPEEKFDQATTSRLNTQERYSTASNSVNNSKKNSESDSITQPAYYIPPQPFLNEIYEGCFLGDLEMDLSPFDRLFTFFEQDHYRSHNIRPLRRDHQTQGSHHQFHSYSQSPPTLPRQTIKYATSPAIYPTNAPNINPFSYATSIEISDPQSPPLLHQKSTSSSEIIELKLFTLPNFSFNPSNNNNAINPMEIFSPIDYTNPKSPVFNLQSLLGPPMTTSNIKPRVESSSLSPLLKRSGIQETAPQKREIKNMNIITKHKTETNQQGPSPLLDKKIRLQSEIHSAQKIPISNKNKVPKKLTNEEFKLWDLISVNGKIQKN